MSGQMIPRFFITRDPYGAATNIHFGGWSPDGKERIRAKPVEMVVEKESEAPAMDKVEPAFCFGYSSQDEILQSLMEELWRIGIRPKDIGTAGHLAATQQHLSDMRSLVEKAHAVTFSPIK